MTAFRGWRRAALLLAVLALAGLTAPLLLSSAAVHADAATPAAATPAAVTVGGTWHRWNPIAHDNGDGTFTGAYDTKTTPSVSVDQTTNLVDQVVHVSWKGFTPSSNDPSYSGPPAPGANVGSGATLYPVEVLQCRSTVPTTSPLGQSKDTSCYTASVTAPTDGDHGINNAVQAVTRPDGTGSVDFHVETAETNDLLGCDPTHACSIVVVPNNGGQQPSVGGSGSTDCANHADDVYGPPDYLDTWSDLLHLGSACTWADRIVVPIHFAPLASSCPAVTPQFTAVGSPMLQRGLTQLQAGWCHGSDSLSFSYNSTSDEYQARNLFEAGGGALTASTDVAFTSQPAAAGSGSRAFHYVPIANNAVVIPYYVDNVITGRPITDLRLDARLVAKLLTQSYQPYQFNCDGAAAPTKQSPTCAPNVAGNPQSIFDDPEFQQLNFRGDHPRREYFPSNAENGNNDVLGGFFPSVLSGNSDMTYALTRWVESDPAARAFLSGKKDKWGMHVNKAYLQKGGQHLYPASQFQPFDPGWTRTKGDPQWNSQGFQATWNPVSGLQNLATYLVAGKSSTQITNPGTCSAPDVNGTSPCIRNPSLPVNFPKVPSEPIGARDLWSVLDNIDAAAYKYPTAQLVNAHGVAVGPTTTGMAKALAHMKTNPDKITQYVDPTTSPAGAYPLTVVDYAMVPTCSGLTAAKAGAIRSFLTHVAGSQSYGVTPGTLAPGMLQLSGRQLAQVRTAAKALDCPAVPAKHTSSSGPTSGSTGGGTNAGGSGGSNAGGGSGGGSRTTKSAASSAQASSSPSSSPAVKRVGFKPAAQNGSMSFVMPMTLIAGLAFLVIGPLTWLLAGTTGGRHALSRLRRVRFW